MKLMIWDWILQLYNQVNWIDTLIALSIMAFFIFFSKVLTKYLFVLFSKKLIASEKMVVWKQAFEKPIRLILVVLGVYLGIRYILPQEGEMNAAIDQLFRTSVIILIGWGMFVISSQTSVLLEQISYRTRLDESSMLIPFLSKTLRVVVIILTVTLVASEWNFSVNGVVAGMGLGSLAIALAAKDSLGNIFGGIVIIVEKPFLKGDWILTPQGEGIVEDITFRSTKIRTFGDAIVIIPNASVADNPITNWSEMGKRRVNFTLNVAMNSRPDQLLVAIKRIEELVTAKEEVDPNSIHVKFTEFDKGSFNILINYYTKSTVYSEYLETRQAINFAVMNVLDEEGIQLAYPTSQIIVDEL